MISGGVLSSCPSQNGQYASDTRWGSPWNSRGRLARSVAMITQRPTIGSLRNSGIGCSSYLPHDAFEVRRGDLHVDGSFARHPVQAAGPAREFDEKAERIVPGDPKGLKRNGKLDHPADGQLARAFDGSVSAPV